MKGAVFLAACLIAFAIAASQARAANEQAYVDPSREMAFTIPNGFQAEEGLGSGLVTLWHKERMRIKVAMIEGVLPSELLLREAVAALHPGARLGNVVRLELGGSDALATSFESRNQPGASGMLLLLKFRGGLLRLDGIAPEKNRSQLVLAVREIATSVHDQVVSDLSVAVAFAQRRALFAIKDGRGGCPGISEESRRVARIAQRLGDATRQQRFEEIAKAFENSDWSLIETLFADDPEIKALRLEREGHVISARALYEERSSGEAGLFATLALGRISLDHADFAQAHHLLSRAEKQQGSGPRSHLLMALMTRLAREEGDVREARTAFESLDHPFCGASDAMAADEYARLVESEDRAAAIRLYEEAISADRSYAPAYLALSRALLEGGASGREVRAQMIPLLKRAPALPELIELRKRLEGQAANRDKIQLVDKARNMP